MPYPELMVRPMREELTSAGFTELRTTEQVDEFMNEKDGTALLVVNSVCGCAAGMARPGVRMALEHEKLPDRLGTVFAGQEVDATNHARSYMAQIPPSSPSMAIFKNGELEFFLPRHRIEGRQAQDVASDLIEAFNQICD